MLFQLKIHPKCNNFCYIWIKPTRENDAIILEDDKWFHMENLLFLILAKVITNLAMSFYDNSLAS
jgi:hypothetical protein